VIELLSEVSPETPTAPRRSPSRLVMAEQSGNVQSIGRAFFLLEAIAQAGGVCSLSDQAG
jgi:hypothetical protein